MAGPKFAPFPPDILEKVEAVAMEHAHLPMPESTGRYIAIKRKA